MVAGTNANLTLTNVQFTDAGTYNVLVGNYLGVTPSSNVVLTVLAAPPCANPGSGLVGWWKGEGNALDSAGTNNGVAQGGLTYGTGEVGQGFVFNGTNAYVKIAANSNLNVGTGAGFTIEAWINPSKVSDQYPIVEWNSGSGYGLQLWIGTPVPYGGGPGCLYANLETTGGGDNRISSAGDLIVSNQYQHVAVTYDKASGVATLYLNGNVVAQRTPGSLTAQTTLDLYLGYRPAEGDVAHYWPGVLDEVSLYSRALTTNEVLAIYNAGGSGKCSSGATAPTITSQPVSQTVTAGSSVSFSVTASGTAPLSYQWSWNASNTLAGATNATLLLTNVQVSQAGNYAVLVSNSAGSVISSNALLTVITNSGGCVSAPANLVGWWKGEGNALDSAGTNNGVAQGGLTYGTGEVGQGFVFNGTNAYVKVPNSSSLDVGSGSGFTVEFWVNPATLDAQPLTEWNSGSIYGAHMWMSVPVASGGSGSGCLFANLYDGSLNHLITTAAGLVVSNLWQHVALTYDHTSGTAVIYLNGAVVMQQSLGVFTPQTTYDLYFGARVSSAGGTTYFAGSMDEGSLYSRVLTAAEVQAIYLAGSAGKCPVGGTAPTITSQPVSQTVVAGGSVSFSVTASGTAPLSYQWSWNASNTLAGATNATLLLTNVQVSQAGNYAVLVSNSAGSVISSNALLTVVTAPTITSQPVSQTVVAGGSVSFSVTASGTAPLSYQWSWNASNTLAGATNATLLLTNVQVSQAGNYAVLVSNSAGSVISSNALLTVITNSGGCVSAPANLVGWWKGEGNALDSAGTNNGVAQGGLTYGTGEVGQGFVFNGTNAYVKIAANSNLNVGTGAGFTIEAWINPSKVSDQYPIVEWNSGSGYGLQLWIGTPVPYGGGPGCLYANLETTGGGDNRISSAGDLIVSNQYQHVAVTYDKASGVATLYLNGNVVAQRTPGSLTAQTTLDLYLGYRPAEGDVAHYWPGVLDEVSLYSRALTTNEVLAIYNAGGSGKCSSGATAPTITSQPVSQTVTAGSSVSFSVTASGTAPLSYQWSWNVSNTLAGATNATLLLTNVQVSQAGNYAVLVSNSAGSVISSNALLTVITNSGGCVSAPANLVGWWKGEGNALDSAGTNNGVAQGGLTYGTGEVGQGFVFNGTNAYVKVPNSSSLDVGSGSGFTVEFWVNPATLDAQPLTEWNSGSIYGAHMWMSVPVASGGSGSGCLFANLYDGSLNHLITTAAGLVVSNLWQHVALTYDHTSGTAVIYLNGAVVMQQSLGVFTPQTTYDLYFGARVSSAGGTTYFAGSMDEGSLYSRVLTAAEVQAIYLAGSAGKCPVGGTAPTITSQPVSQTVVAGGSVSFSVTASGTAPLSYQWSWNASNTLAGATNATLLLTNVQVSQAGNYAVLVSNSAGSVISSNALLTVITNSGGCVSAPANLVGWWKGEGNALDSAGTNNGVAQGGLTYGTGEVGQGFVFNGTNAYVKIAANSNLNVGTGAGFTIEAWINPSKVSDQYPIVEWNSGSGYGLQLWIGTPVPYGGGPGCLYANLETTGGGDNRISSAGDLIVSNQYQHVAVTYDKASGVATLYLNGNVVAQRTPGSLTAQTTLDLYLGYWPAEGDVAHYWPGVLDEVSLYSRALTTNEVLAIYNAGGSGKCSSGATAPTITSQPVSQTVTAGSSVSFSVTASGTAPLSYQWSWNASNTLAGATNATLLLTNVQVSQAGNYAVLVSNSAGSVISSNALLTVITNSGGCVSAPANLVGWWKGEGNALDSAGTNNGVAQGGLTYGTGEVGQGFVFNGTNAYVKVPNSSSLDVGSGSGFTVEFWVNPATLDAQPLTEWNSGSIYGAHMWMSVPVASGGSGSGCLFANLYDGSLNHLITTAAGLVVSNLWQHVALTYDHTSGTAVIYLNGAVVMQQSLGVFTPQTTYDLYFGARVSSAGGTTYFAGSMDEGSLYSRVLTAAEVQAIYLAGSAGKCPVGGTAPTITSQPVSQTVVAGGSVSFSVTASGTAPLSYQWSWNASNTLAGATNAPCS